VLGRDNNGRVFSFFWRKMDRLEKREERRQGGKRRNTVTLARPPEEKKNSPPRPHTTMQRALAARPSAARPVARRGAVVARAATKAPVSEREREGKGERRSIAPAPRLPTLFPPRFSLRGGRSERASAACRPACGSGRRRITQVQGVGTGGMGGVARRGGGRRRRAPRPRAGQARERGSAGACARTQWGHAVLRSSPRARLQTRVAGVFHHLCVSAWSWTTARQGARRPGGASECPAGRRFWATTPWHTRGSRRHPPLSLTLSLLSLVHNSASPQTVADVRAALDAAEKLEKAGGSKADIKAAWDKVAAGAAAAAGAVFQLTEAELAARSVAADKVLENFCDSNPDADECRVYDD
jgi:hypothetical protein